MHAHKFIIITGPTASGKTALSHEVAHKIGGEIINADVGQFYKPLSVGTAKPDLKTTNIPHHLFDIVETPININVALFKELVLKKISEIYARGRIPILVGGSLFYIKSLFFSPLNLESLCALHIDQIVDQYAQTSNQELWNILYEIDARRADALHPHDRYRILRALFLWHSLVKKPSECKPSFEFNFDAFILYINPEQEEHKKNIILRTHQMLEQGWMEEAESLLGDEWKTFLDKKGLIGYSDIFLWLDHGKRAEEKQVLAQTIAQKTWQYARRQRIFWASFKEQLMSAYQNSSKTKDLEIFETSNFSLIIHKISDFLKKM